MKGRWWVFLAAPLFVFFQGKKADFEGKWALDLKKSVNLPPSFRSVESYVLDITQKGDSLIVVATFVGWSIWTIEAASAQTWGAALGLPAMKGAAWTLPAWVIVYGLPWAPFAAFASSQSVRGRWTLGGRA